MNIAEKIKMVFEGATGLSLLYGNNNEINRAIGYGQLPCGIMRLLDTTTIVQDNGTIVERASVFVGVINMTSEETPSYATERVISSCRDELYKFIKATYNNDLVRFGSLTDATRLYEQYDDIVCGYGAQISIEEYPSSCIEPSSPYQAKDVEPSIDDVLVLPDGGYVALSQVLVKAVTADIDANIVAENIKKDVTILGVTGTLASKPEQSKTVAPQTSELTVLPDEGYALSDVKVEAVTSEIDANIVAGNIKKDVTILGVEGSYQGERPIYPNISFTNWVSDTLGYPNLNYRLKADVVQAQTSATVMFDNCRTNRDIDLSHMADNIIDLTNVSYMFRYAFGGSSNDPLVTFDRNVKINFGNFRILPLSTNTSNFFYGMGRYGSWGGHYITIEMRHIDFVSYQAYKGNKTTAFNFRAQFNYAQRIHRWILSSEWDNSLQLYINNTTTDADLRATFETLPNVTDGQVLTITSAIIAKASAETILYITSKGWTLA